jgi:hypothetical protein
MEIEMFEIRALMRDAADHAVKQYRMDNGEEQIQMSLRAAYRKYGKSNVSHWIKSRLIIPKKRNEGRNGKLELDAATLDILYKTTNRYD